MSERLKNGIPVFQEKTYKNIAIIAMAICHIVMLLIVPVINTSAVTSVWAYVLIWRYTYIMYSPLLFLFMFPVEAFFHTSNRRLYLLRMLVMAIIAELPYDLATMISRRSTIDMKEPVEYLLCNKDLIFKEQNVMFSLALGFMAICAIDKIRRDISFITPKNVLRQLLYTITALCVTVIAGYIGHTCRLDHEWWIAVTMVLFYIFHDHRALMCIVPSAFIALCGLYILHNSFFVSCIIGGLCLFFYSGKRGHITSTGKLFYYWFYPIHLLIIYILQVLIFYGWPY